MARWDDADGEALRRSAEDLAARVPSGPPPGVPSKGLLMLIDPDSGRSLAISLYETEEDLRQGDETLNAMSPDPSAGNVGTRTSVEMYEVAVDVRI
ncbi:MAG: hypothetical protein WBC33_10695 [Conexibacter sp.]